MTLNGDFFILVTILICCVMCAGPCVVITPEQCRAMCEPHPVEVNRPLQCDCLTPNEWDSSGPRAPTGHSRGKP